MPHRPDHFAMTTEQIRISGKTLGQLALPDFCPRCFWLTMWCDHKLPFQIFPGIFSSIDSYTKRVGDAYHQKHHHVPEWLSDFGDLGEPMPVPHHSKYQTLHTETNILLTGVPDELYRRPDKTIFIGDNKTARFTSGQDELLPMYRVQLNGYALIAERIGMGKASGVGLIYYEPQTDVSADSVDAVLENDGFNMRFAAKLLPIELRPSMVPPLLARVREICNLTVAPSGRQGCEDCQRVERLVEIAR
jgi:hypothetical protein